MKLLHAAALSIVVSTIALSPMDATAASQALAIGPKGPPADARVAPTQQIRTSSTGVKNAGTQTFYVACGMDPVWAAGAEKSLVEAASEPQLAEFGIPRRFNANCMGRICKVTLSFDTQGQASDWSELYVLSMSDAVSLVQTMVTTTGMATRS